MPILTVMPEGKTFTVPMNARFLDIAFDQATGLLFGCRAGACGTCMLRVVANPENISPIRKSERHFLDAVGASADKRLACVSRIIGDVTVEQAPLPDSISSDK